VGKTRLALAVVDHLLNAFADGVCWVALAGIRTPALVMDMLTQTLGIPPQTGHRSAVDLIVERLRDKEMLLLLDNFEHVLAAAPELAAVVAACPRLSVLVTSRERLHLQGEQEYPVPPLQVPTIQPSDLDIKALRQVAAVKLFVQRAQAVSPGFVLDDGNGLAVAQLCIRLDGLPLAIELAATRIKLFPPSVLLRQLTRRFDVLKGGPQDAPLRHQTLRRALDWSYELLDHEEQSLFRRLAVFVGGCTLEAVSAIWAAEAGEGEAPATVLDKLAALVDKSLVQQVSNAAEPRFVLLETFREYGLERLREAGEEMAAQRGHALYYLTLAETAEPLLIGAEQARWLDRLDMEHSNLRAALQWSIHYQAREQTGEIGQRLGAALWHFWYIRGYYNEGWDWLNQLLAMPGQPAVQAALHHGKGMLARRLGEPAVALSCFTESLALYEHVGDKRGMASALRVQGFIHHQQGNLDAAQPLLEESLKLFRELDDQEDVAATLSNLGYVAQRQNDWSQARRLQEESLALRRLSGNQHGMIHNLASLSYVAMGQGDLDAAQAYAQEYLAISRELNVPNGITVATRILGKIAYAQGDYVTAHTCFEKSMALAQENGDKGLTAAVAFDLATTTIKHGDARAARLLLEQALRLSQEQGIQPSILKTLEYMAGLAATQQQPKRALMLAGAAAARPTGPHSQRR
jgi:non-specific serine/threonine protein kinase